jgi:hypothetical protein
VAIETTPRGFKKPDGLTELVKKGAEMISDNAQKADDLLAAREAVDTVLAARIGVTEAKIDAGAGGPGLSEDPDHPGLYYFAGPAFSADPAHPGLYSFEEATP